MSAAEHLDTLVGREVAGGCARCPAVQRVERQGDGIYSLTIAHDDHCPTLRLHAEVLPLRVKVAELRRQWHLWHGKTPEELAQRDDIDFNAMFPEADCDRVLAARAWRASVLAQLEVLGTEFARRLADAESGGAE